MSIMFTSPRTRILHCDKWVGEWGKLTCAHLRYLLYLGTYQPLNRLALLG